MAPIAATGVEALIDGGALTTAIRLKCPVTGESTLFDDFECIAFCPQSRDEADPLYDPLMFAPYPCVNLSSDVFAFSSFVADSALSAWGRPVYCEPSPERIEPLLQLCVDRWQRIATKTIRNFEAVTNTALCPVHVGADETYWVAHHKDPAFAERKKEAHAHELPVIYANRIVDAWMRHFRGERAYRAGGLAREGLPA